MLLLYFRAALAAIDINSYYNYYIKTHLYRCHYLTVTGYRLYACRARHITDVTDYLVLDVGSSGHPGDFCRAVALQQVEGNAYDVNVLFCDVSARDVSETTSAGLMYNVVDENNYDFVVFRYDCCLVVVGQGRPHPCVPCGWSGVGVEEDGRVW